MSGDNLKKEREAYQVESFKIFVDNGFSVEEANEAIDIGNKYALQALNLFICKGLSFLNAAKIASKITEEHRFQAFKSLLDSGFNVDEVEDKVMFMNEHKYKVFSAFLDQGFALNKAYELSSGIHTEYQYKALDVLLNRGLNFDDAYRLSGLINTETSFLAMDMLLSKEGTVLSVAESVRVAARFAGTPKAFLSVNLEMVYNTIVLDDSNTYPESQFSGDHSVGAFGEDSHTNIDEL